MYTRAGAGAGPTPTGPTPPGAAAAQKPASDYTGYGGYAGYTQVSELLFDFPVNYILISKALKLSSRSLEGNF